MNEFEVYQQFLSLKNHFTKKDYDYFKYNGKVRVNPDTYSARKDRIFFQKVAKHPDVTNFIVANLVENNKMWIRDLAYSEKAKNIYQSWATRQQALTYTFKQELKTLEEFGYNNLFVCNDGHPELMHAYWRGDISFDTFCILVLINDKLIEYWDKKLKYDPVWDEVKLKLVKYTPFLKFDKDKFLKIVIDIFGEV